jgi:hypothetical protein
MQATLNRCILIDLTRTRLGEPIATDERADALLVLRNHAAAIGATLDLSDLFRPKLFVNYGIAEHRDAGEGLRRMHTLRVIGA